MFFQLYTACELAVSLILVLTWECSDHAELFNSSSENVISIHTGGLQGKFFFFFV